MVADHTGTIDRQQRSVRRYAAQDFISVLIGGHNVYICGSHCGEYTSRPAGGTAGRQSPVGGRETHDTRAQTTIDLAVGISLFLLVLTFVFLFVPDLLEPFNTGSQEETVAVNRAADELTQRQLGNASEPYVLNATCTAKFFDREDPGTCNYGDGETVGQQLGLDGRLRVNVTVTRVGHPDLGDGDDIHCWDADTTSLTVKSSGDCTSGSGDVALQAGPAFEQGSVSSVSARRVVTLDGQAVSLTVVMW